MSTGTDNTADRIPERLNMARYCIGDRVADPAIAGKVALVVVHDHDAPAPDAERWTYRELDDAVRAIGHGMLAAGLTPGQRVLLRLANTSDYPLCYFAAMAVGLVAVPSSAMLLASEIDHLVRDSGAAAVISDRPVELPEGARLFTDADVAGWRAGAGRAEYADTAAQDPAYLVYTSGTSGRPKGVLHAHRAVWGRRPMKDGWLGIGADDVLLHAGAFNWTYTLGVGLADPWANGATALVYNGSRDPAIWARLIGEHRATLFAAVPGVYRQLMKYADLTTADLTSLRHGLTAGEALNPALYRRWREQTGKELYESLGMSEVSTFISTGPGMAVHPGSPGRPQPGRRIAVLEPDGGDQPLPDGQVGLLAVHRSDPGLMLRYWNADDENPYRGEWFVSGDLVHLDGDGYLIYHGRGDDVMNAGGYRVSPVEVENVLVQHPDVGEVACVEYALEDGLTVIAAFVVPVSDDDGVHAVDGEDVMAFAEFRLARYKRPRKVIVVDALPRTANGKVLRSGLRRPVDG